MINKKNVLVGMSGGVDSTIAVILLKNQGYQVTGLHLLLWKMNEDSLNEKKEIGKLNELCDELKIPIIHYDVKELFYKTIILDQKNKLLKGLTPNPCIRCNPLIKFNLLEKIAKEKAIQFIATGHYATVKKVKNTFGIFKAKDQTKDQTYFLSNLGQNTLSKTLMPLGDTLKKDNIEMASKCLGVEFSSGNESQDLCFLGENRYEEFLNRFDDEISKPGDILDINGNKLGEHIGLAHYTIGQRKGIRIPAGKPYYVVKKDIECNQIVVGHANEISFTGVNIVNVNWVRGEPDPKKSYHVKIRYRAKDSACYLRKDDDNKYSIKFNKTIRDPAPGQFAVLYDENELLGGGEISEVY